MSKESFDIKHFDFEFFIESSKNIFDKVGKFEIIFINHLIMIEPNLEPETRLFIWNLLMAIFFKNTRFRDKIDVLDCYFISIPHKDRITYIEKNDVVSEGSEIISFHSFKGGVGKTFISLFLSAFISEEQDKKVLWIDMDANGTSSYLLVKNSIAKSASNVEEASGLYSIFKRIQEEIIDEHDPTDINDYMKMKADLQYKEQLETFEISLKDSINKKLHSWVGCANLKLINKKGL